MLLALAIFSIIYFSVLIFAPLPSRDFFVSGNKQTGMGCADFVIFYGAGALSTSPDRFNIYDLATQLKIENHLIAPNAMGQPFYIQYPPWFFTLMAPWSLVPIKSAFVIWSIVWTVLASLSMYLLLGTTALRSKLDQALFISFTLASAPTVVNMKLGQTSFWFFTCACLLFFAWRKQAFKQVALWLALSTIKLQYSVFLVVPLIARKKWSALFWTGLFQLVLITAACLNVGWQSLIKYPAFLLSVETSGASVVAPESMANFGALLLHFFPSKIAQVGSLAALILALLYLFSVWWRSGQSSKRGDAWPIAVTCVIGLVASPHTHFHMCVLLSIAAAVTLKSISLTAAVRDKSLAYRYWAMLLLYAPLLSWVYFISAEQLSFPVLPLFNLVLAALAIVNTELDLRTDRGELA
jgi:hypothetical protein